MSTHPVHDPDAGIGFDMRNAHLYNDSDDEEENVDKQHRPRPYPHKKNEGNFTCCYVIIILIILALGSIIGYSLGSTFSIQPEPYKAATEPPNASNNNNNNNNNVYAANKRNTPQPTRKDPFHRKKHGGITDIFAAPKNTPYPTASAHAPKPAAPKQAAPKPAVKKQPEPAEKPVFEPSATTNKVFEPSATGDGGGKPAFEPSAVKQPAPENKGKGTNDVELKQNYDINAIKKVLNDANKYDLDFNDKILKLDDEYDLGDSAILTKIVLDGYEIPYIFEHAHRFNVKYPNSNNNYGMNQYRRWCFNFYLFDYPAAQIDITFNSFQLERGFDRILIRHFNQSFIDPPLVYAGRGIFDENKYQWILPERVTYHLRKNQFKTICVEMETDDSVSLKGVDFNVDIKYDDCKWTEYTQCNIPDESKKHWDRGPFYDGTCGIGVKQRNRTRKEQDKDAPPLNKFEAFVNCDNKDDTDIDGPDYCLKAPCESVDNFHNPKGIPSNIRYGWGNKTTFYNGVGTLDAKNPDLLRILTAHPSTPKTFKNQNEIKKYLLSPSFVALYGSYPIYQVNPDEHIFDLTSIISALEDKKKEILSEHVDENVLTMPVLKLKYTDKTMEWLGARLTHSLLIGRPFTMIFTGSSNTAGHDNQFSSTYPMQLQSRLRTLWSSIGVDGAAMNIRNEAVGGAPKTETMAWFIHSRSSETVAYPFNNINVFKSGGFWRNEDIIFWESFMNDGGRPPHLATEQQLRLTALLNAIWGGMNSITSVNADQCRIKLSFKALRAPKHLTRDNLFGSFTDIYGQYMGLLEMDFDTFVHAVCSQPKYQTLKINWHPNAGGHRCEADIYAYTLLSAAIKFMKNNEKIINQKKIDKTGTQALDDWLVQKSGNWGEKYMLSIQKKDDRIFPSPKYCQPFCDKTIAPFAIKTCEPYEWNIGFRFQDYVIYDYNKMDDNTTAINHVDGIDDERIPDIKSRFSISKLARSMGWDYGDLFQREPPHYPQDRTGKLGSQDRQPSFMPNEKIWIKIYETFLNKKHPNDVEAFSKGINIRDKTKKQKAREIFGKYPVEFGQYILENNYDLKVAFLVPEIGNHSILTFTGEGSTDLYGIDGKYTQKIGINLETMDRKNKINKKYMNYNYDFNKRLTEQRQCIKYQKGCVFHQIPPGKYIMRYYPMNMTLTTQSPLLQIVAF